VPAGYGEAGFQPSGITFPSTGCWKVEGHLGGTTLAFVVRVVIRATTTAKPSATFRVVLPKPHSRWKDLFAVEIIPTQRLPVPVKMWLYNAAHHVVAHHWLGACSTCPTPAGGTLTVNVRYHVEHVQAGMVTILDPASGYRVSVPVILTNLPAPTE
jgi:hypothetical protein